MKFGISMQIAFLFSLCISSRGETKFPKTFHSVHQKEDNDIMMRPDYYDNYEDYNYYDSYHLPSFPDYDGHSSYPDYPEYASSEASIPTALPDYVDSTTAKSFITSSDYSSSSISSSISSQDYTVYSSSAVSSPYSSSSAGSSPSSHDYTVYSSSTVSSPYSSSSAGSSLSSHDYTAYSSSTVSSPYLSSSAGSSPSSHDYTAYSSSTVTSPYSSSSAGSSPSSHDYTAYSSSTVSSPYSSSSAGSSPLSHDYPAYSSSNPITANSHYSSSSVGSSPAFKDYTGYSYSTAGSTTPLADYHDKLSHKLSPDEAFLQTSDNISSLNSFIISKVPLSHEQLMNSSISRNVRNRKCACGIANRQTRIFQGNNVLPPHKFPWLVFITIKIGKKIYKCGGAIINENFVLSAAHCFAKHSSKDVYSPKTIRVTIGDSSRKEDDDIPGVTQKVHVFKVIVHEGFSKEHGANDIALLRLAKPLDLTTHKEVGAVCLPDRSSTIIGRCVAAGWGLLNHEKQQAIKLQEALVIVREKCFKFDRYWKLDPTFFCLYGSEQKSFLCRGDSGSPVMHYNKGKMDLIGIVSNSISYQNENIKCAVPSGQTFVVNVKHYLNWIYRHVPQSTCK